jgi:hypothetical protein
MANQFSVNVYQIDQTVMPRDSPFKFGFPTTNVQTQDVSGSSTRSLSSGYNVYGLINFGGSKYYVAETFSQLATLIG